MRDWHGLHVLVNKSNPLPADFVPKDLVIPEVSFSFSEDHPRKYLRREAAVALERLFAYAQTMGIYLVAASGYRSYETQAAIFANHVERLGTLGANRESARPGESEHQTGLAMDITSKLVGFKLVEEFGSTPEGRWLATHASQFGFILRYPVGKEKVTGYIYEPWHYRYLGENLAHQVTESGLTYEEFLLQEVNTQDD
ncbi:D-alanyl-D-alanine carboxypeptidase [Marininema mesophilum]|uniref:D-alanyl-D-alanine carboxypeptidase n=1 Tax=Marininema mesophilum TaxID=1048340 RepID=A0A1H3BM30_9BACL|nr:M15 family metallopeptidase [Marininema mesophilum]SDX42781.1 D-alanyl-D-alanine carboxypeptidase [Marininema mesophilum]